MPNTIQISSLVLAQTAEILHDKSFMYKMAYKNISNEFTRNSGNSITVPKPTRPAVGTTADMTSTDRTMYEGSVTLTTVRRNAGVDLTSAERTYKLGGEELVRERVTMPLAKRLAREIDLVGLSTLWAAGGKRISRSDYTAALSFTDAAKMNAALSRGLAPDDNRCIALSDDDWALASAGLSTFFNPQNVIGDSLKAGGVKGDLAGMMWYPTQSMPTFTVACDDAAGTVNDTVGEGDQVITLAGLGTGTIKAGVAFTIPDVYELDPETQQSNGKLYTFIVAADATIAGNAATVTLAQPMYTTATNRTLANMSALPANSAVVTFIEGAISKAGKGVIAWHPQALLFASVDLFKPKAGVISEGISVDGLNMRLVDYGDGVTDVYGTRLDIEFGFAAVYNELIATTGGVLA